MICQLFCLITVHSLNRKSNISIIYYQCLALTPCTEHRWRKTKGKQYFIKFVWPKNNGRKQCFFCLSGTRSKTPVSSRVRRNFGEKFASRGREENIQHVWYFLPREANSSSCAATVRIWLSPIHRLSNKIAWPTHVTLELDQNFAAHVRKRLSKLPREALCSALSSPCAAGFRYAFSKWKNNKPWPLWKISIG